ncbi:hypothetical protein QE441_002874 [Chryseobacterium sp. SORGH_AS909]|uniref:Uncharacterized protein n=1 Tax=Chryseobacterium camelliae TaxID=1265445 RepID=A0ABU0THT6_9FLAO|nr:hypothetical protein [Chryseobacterium camelliae]MDQ1099732.1 hypothetical protein [Chryseobacterium sp. SORGH_AS_1048]MDR6087080.1 hypothetical protein [Chryseobacterium sp. SORGH_AS_0909]MDR6131453.1 hypothetical protein [Chryseobacterium sp. SORGH_AS_1175]MDT3406405.1 hypothetical protein [Pseudacidovorax intermedius]
MINIWLYYCYTEEYNFYFRYQASFKYHLIAPDTDFPLLNLKLNSAGTTMPYPILIFIILFLDFPEMRLILSFYFIIQ